MWSALAQPEAGLRCVVVLPVRNEAAHLHEALAALAAQRTLVGVPFDRASFEILLLANNCDDASAAIARAFARAHPGLRLHVVEVALDGDNANIGYVRGRLMDEACRRLELAGCPHGVIASTDGDTRVAGDWLARTEVEIAAGADAVGGRIFTDAAAQPSAAALRLRRMDAAHSLLRSRLADLLDPEPVDPWPRHHQHFGASLAVTARAYRLAGGMPVVRYLEDEALIAALRRADLRVRHSPAVRVTTSSRLDGRAEVGLSWQLRQWAHEAAERHEPVVESPTRFVHAMRTRAALRRAWTARHGAHDVRVAEAGGASSGWSLPPEEVSAILAGAPSFGAAWEALQSLGGPSAARPEEVVPMSHAVAELRHRIRTERLSFSAS